MRNVFTDGYNMLIYEDAEDCPIEYLGQNLYALIGLVFHYAQQNAGRIELNNVQILAASMAQTDGGSASPCDYVRIGDGSGDGFRQLSKLIYKAEKAEVVINIIKEPRLKVD